MSRLVLVLLLVASCDRERTASTTEDAARPLDAGSADAGFDAWYPPYMPPDAGPPPDAGAPPTVACRMVGGGGGSDAGSAEAGDAMDASAEDAGQTFDESCTPPRSECVGATSWVVYWTSDGCGADGACRFTAMYVHCPSGCYDGGCDSGFT